MTLDAVGLSAATEPRAILFHAPGAHVENIAAALRAERIELRETDHIEAIQWYGDTPAVLLLTRSMIADAGPVDQALAVLPDSLVVVAEDDGVVAAARSDRVFLTLPTSRDADATLRLLAGAYRMAAAAINAQRAERELKRTRNELVELQRIGMALMTERDPDALLVQILDQAKRLTHSDAGSLYLVERDEAGQKRLRFKLSQNDSLQNLPFVEFTLPINEASIAGYVASTGKPLSLDDAYHIDAAASYSFNRSFDERFGYRTRSMLVVPMSDHRDAVVGVLQLINSKSDPLAVITSEDAADDYVLPYGQHELNLVQSLAGQAAVSIENSRLYLQIQNLFESFVKAAVTAIDQRDPTTAGHSIRVATLTVDVAEALERGGTGAWAGVTFTRDQMRELRYAAMLHDFGKVGVREEVLIKAKKLPPYLFERVESRFHLIRRTAEADYYRRRADLVRAGVAEGTLQELEQAFEAELHELENFHEAVRTANQPSVLPQESAAILGEIALRRFRSPHGDEQPFLSTDELHFLTIPKGTLDERERVEIESHVEQTFRFLSQIPWTDDLRNLADIAYGHHEKLNGAGYPRGIGADSIPVQTRIMTISDIFDALTASDRPYKPALPVERALSIIEMEAKQGMLDTDLVQMFIEGQLYRKVLEQNWRSL
ncbi:MAG TPA: HD domain-containing phosphohydrolase [Longimicrobiales bacterium]|nr:HD domain-containing phosphohydrolase [Longimicrobiales bacterium]